MRKTTKMVAVLAAMSVMILGAATMVSAAEKKNGWVKEGSDWYYYNDDKAIINGWAQDGAGLWYFLGDEGKMVKESFVDNDALLVVSSTEITDGDDRAYYYVDANGVMVTDWVKVKTGTTGNGPTEEDSTAWRYFGTNGVMYASEWILSGSNWYWVKETGVMAEKFLHTTGDEHYYLAKGGAMVTGWYKATSDDATHGLAAKDKWVYANADGELVQDGWKKVNGAWYYFGNSAVESGNAIVSPSAVTGTSIDGSTNYEMNADGFIKVGSDIFHLKSSGAMSTGAFKFNTKNYYAKSNGVLQKGIQDISGRNYYFDVKTYVKDVDSDYIVKTGDVYRVGTYENDTAVRNDKSTGFTVYKLGTGTKFVK